MKLNDENSHSFGEDMKKMRQMRELGLGQCTLSCSPATLSRTAYAGTSFTRSVVITLFDSLSQVITWVNTTVEVKISAAKATASANLCTITSNASSLILANGQQTVVLSGTSATWAATETNTLTIKPITLFGHTYATMTSVQTMA